MHLWAYARSLLSRFWHQRNIITSWARQRRESAHASDRKINILSKQKFLYFLYISRFSGRPCTYHDQLGLQLWSLLSRVSANLQIRPVRCALQGQQLSVGLQLSLCRKIRKERRYAQASQKSLWLEVCDHSHRPSWEVQFHASYSDAWLRTGTALASHYHHGHNFIECHSQEIFIQKNKRVRP